MSEKVVTNLKESMINKLEKEFQEIIFNILQLDKFGVPKQHIAETPKRIAKMLVNELLEGVYVSPSSYKLTEFDFQTDLDTTKSHDLVMVQNLEVKSLCSHHFMPFYGKATIAYIPDTKILGLSKFARVVDYFSRRPQVQEELTKQIIEFINDFLHPLGIGCIIKAKHMCMQHRGVNSNGEMITMKVIGKDEVIKREINNTLRRWLNDK